MSNTGDMHWIQWKRTTQPFISHLCLDSCSPPFSDSTQEEHLHLGFGSRDPVRCIPPPPRTPLGEFWAPAQLVAGNPQIAPL